MTSFHRYATFDKAMDYVRLGWMPLPTLDGTPHGRWSVHLIWLCNCPPPKIRDMRAEAAHG